MCQTVSFALDRTESKWHKIKGDNMNQEMTERIAETKELVITAEWREKILACQESGKPVTAWCEENGISPSTYYRKLRMMREDITIFPPSRTRQEFRRTPTSSIPFHR